MLFFLTFYTDNNLYKYIYICKWNESVLFIFVLHAWETVASVIKLAAAAVVPAAMLFCLRFARISSRLKLFQKVCRVIFCDIRWAVSSSNTAPNAVSLHALFLVFLYQTSSCGLSKKAGPIGSLVCQPGDHHCKKTSPSKFRNSGQKKRANEHMQVVRAILCCVWMNKEKNVLFVGTWGATSLSIKLGWSCVSASFYIALLFVACMLGAAMIKNGDREMRILFCDIVYQLVQCLLRCPNARLVHLYLF